MRKTHCFNENWLFQLENKVVSPFMKSELDDSGWRSVCLPHDWSVEGPFEESAPAGGDGGYLPCGTGWYRKHFMHQQSESTDISGCFSIFFDGAYQKCEVWLNGQRLGYHAFGYMGFGFDITSFLKEGDNVIAVRVDNSVQPNSRWYSGSGITRSVWLTETGTTRISQWGISITTKDLNDEQTIVTVSAEIEGLLQLERGVRFTIIDGYSCAIEKSIQIEDNGIVKSELLLSKPRRWSHENPEMYQLKVEIISSDGAITYDEKIVPFGIRAISFDKDKGFMNDGKRVKLRGVCLHHDGGCVGAAVPKVVWHRRLLTLKKMGCNAIRMSHNPPDPGLLDLCDELGFYVMDEAFDEWKIIKAKNGLADHGYGELWEENHIQDCSDMILRDRNHPSIILWSIGNEIPEQSEPGGELMARELVDLCHKLDPTRLVVSACDNIKGEPKPSKVEFLNTLDIVGANYINRWRNRTELFYAEERHEHPEWSMVGTEHGAVGGYRARYELDGQEPHPWFGNYRTRMVRVAPLLKYTEAYDFVAGDFMWTGIDYLGECRWPHKNASSGCLDTCGFEKDAFYLYQSVWTSEPMIHLFPHWNWTRREGQVIQMLTYSNCDTAELFVNGKSYGKKSKQFPLQGMTQKYGHFDKRISQPTTADLHFQWDVPFEPGVIEVVGYREGERVCSDKCETTGKPAMLAIRDDNPIDVVINAELGNADNHAYHQFVLSVLDSTGQLVPDAEIPISVEVTGSAKLIAMDNGMPEDRTPFQNHSRSSLGGLAYVLVKTVSAGEFTVLVQSDGIKKATFYSK